MNLVSVTVTAAIMGLTIPDAAQMAIISIIAQKPATNFGVAESRAVAYSAFNEGAPTLTLWRNDELTGENNPATRGCVVTGTGDNAHIISCTYPVAEDNEPVMYPT